MRYNPLQKKFDSLKEKIEELNDIIKQNEISINTYKSTDINKLKKQSSDLSLSITENKIELSKLRNEWDRLKKEWWIFKPFIFYPLTALELFKINSKIKELEKITNLKSEEHRSLNKKITEHNKFDANVTQKETEELKSELLAKETEFKELKPRKKKVDNALKSVVEEIKSMEYQLENAKSRLSIATDYDHRLSSAKSPRQRAIIHNKCEKYFGEGKPHLIIRKENSTIRKIERDLDKAINRAEMIGINSAKLIKKIIIDGNNFCYEGSDFVGLKPIKKLVSEISSESYDTIIVFDSAIRSMMKMNDQQLAKEFPDSINIHVVSTSELADETVLDLASENTSFVLSNDRFADFKEKAAVKDERIIRHQIVDGHIFIHDLDIRLTF
ncbi:MAG: hypothetical protein WD053_05455 [Gracilimonas sp.]